MVPNDFPETPMAGKLWWPYQASLDDTLAAAGAFHARLGERGWLPDRVPVRPLQVGITDLTFEGAHWLDLNEFLQIERDPTAGKTQSRQALALLLPQLAKWHMGLRPESRWMDIPRVLAVPARDGTFRHLVLGRLSGVPGLVGAAGLPLTLVVSELEALPEPAGTLGRGKTWGVAAGGDSSRWLQANTWRRQRQLPSFSKLVWAPQAERMAWLSSAAVADDMRGQGLRTLDVVGTAQREAAKQVGAIWSPTLGQWVLGEYWDAWPCQDWIRGADARAAKLPPWKRPGDQQKYSGWKKTAGQATPPPPKEAADTDAGR
jgi:hypothetical protein